MKGVSSGWGNVILQLVWIGLLAIALLTVFSNLRLLQSGNTVTGTVVELQASNSDEGLVYAPIVEYQVGTQTYRIASPNATDPPAYQVGQQVQVLYPSDNPSQGRMNSAFELWAIPVVLAGAGILLAVFVNRSRLFGMVQRR